ncbi:MAG: hypothetical protein CSB06_01905 [Bacteroidia bacterium]|nr:MAG: hypothetical protein CSB06_01905 [Bacteroidia bacterium]
MIKIKCVFPKDYYLLRKVNIKTSNKTIAYIGHNEVVDIDEAGEYIEFKLDYHKAKIKVPDLKTAKYLILYFNFRNNFPFSVTDIMFKNSLCAKFVDVSEFNSFSESFYKQRPSEPMTFNNTSVYTILAALLILGQFLLVPFLNFNNSNSTNDFIFFIGIVSFIGFLLTIVNRNNIANKQYYIRILAFGIMSILLLTYIKYDIIFKAISIILALSIVLISTNKLLNISRKKSRHNL